MFSSEPHFIVFWIPSNKYVTSFTFHSKEAISVYRTVDSLDCDIIVKRVVRDFEILYQKKSSETIYKIGALKFLNENSFGFIQFELNYYKQVGENDRVYDLEDYWKFLSSYIYELVKTFYHSHKFHRKDFFPHSINIERYGKPVNINDYNNEAIVFYIDTLIDIYSTVAEYSYRQSLIIRENKKWVFLFIKYRLRLYRYSNVQDPREKKGSKTFAPRFIEKISSREEVQTLLESLDTSIAQYSYINYLTKIKDLNNQCFNLANLFNKLNAIRNIVVNKRDFNDYRFSIKASRIIFYLGLIIALLGIGISSWSGFKSGKDLRKFNGTIEGQNQIIISSVDTILNIEKSIKQNLEDKYNQLNDTVDKHVFLFQQTMLKINSKIDSLSLLNEPKNGS